jgi:hypothetical protein
MINGLPKGYVYLASPYTHDDVYVREDRFLQAVKACAYALNEWRVNITNSIVFTHPILTRYPMPVEWEFWARYDGVIINLCEEVWVLCVPGYTHSMGLNSEVKLGRDSGKRIRYMIPTANGYELQDECPKEEDLYGKVFRGRLATETL